MTTTWERIKVGLDKALEITRKSAKIIADKAGETAKITKLSVEAMTLEHQMSKKFAELGSIAYLHIQSSKKGSFSALAKVKKLIEETKKIENKLNQNHKAMEAERKKK